jgi:phosphate transport system substrate-binding protein
MDSLIEGDGLRVDTAPLSDEAAVISAVSADGGQIGVVSLQTALAAGDAIKIVELDFGEAGCAAPSAENVEGRLYSASQPILAYRSFTASADTLIALNYAVSEAAANAIAQAGFTAPTADTWADMRDGLANGTPGRLYTRTITTFEISPGISGAIEIGGAANDFEYVNNLATAFTATYATVTTNVNIEGSVAGLRRLCNGELDIAVTFAPLTQEQLDNCAANNITPFDLDLGSQAVVVLRNSADTFAECLTTAELAAIFTTPVVSWDQVDAENPAALLFAFMGDAGSATENLLLLSITGTNNPGRTDVQRNADPLYRAAATGATSGVISVYSWNEYQVVVNSAQQNLSPVQVDAGAGCAEPTESNIEDGSYALARPLTLTVNRASFAKPQVQSLLWFAISDENFLSLSEAGLVGLEFGELPELRATLQETYTQVAVEVAEAAARAAEATAQATSEVTPEATAESTTAP